MSADKLAPVLVINKYLKPFLWFKPVSANSVKTTPVCCITVNIYHDIVATR